MSVWIPVKGYEEFYKVSNEGEVWSNKRVIETSHGNAWEKQGGKLKLLENPETGYLTVRLHKNGEWKQKYVHRIVLKSFVGSPPTENHEGNHINHNKKDNRLKNLEWTTRSENLAKAANRQKKLKEEGLTKLKVGYVKWMYKNLNVRLKAIADQFKNISESNISNWGNGDARSLIQLRKPPKEIIDQVKKRSVEYARFKVLPKTEIQKLKWIWNRKNKLGINARKMADYYGVSRSYFQGLNTTYSFSEKRPSRKLVEQFK